MFFVDQSCLLGLFWCGCVPGVVLRRSPSPSHVPEEHVGDGSDEEDVKESEEPRDGETPTGGDHS